jgi:peptide/nickel transport system substrate-binding protein
MLRHACAPRLGRATLAAGAFALAGASFALPAEAQRITLVMDPPSVETNLFWANAGDSPLPSLQGLVGHDPESGAYDSSGVAESWEANDDFTTWTFRIHPDAEFHYGWGSVTAEDVVHSYELHTQPDSILIGVSLLRGADLEIVDELTVAFHLPEPRPDFLFAHGGRGAMLVYSKAQWDEEGEQGYVDRPAGTAPIRYVSREIGRGVTFERVADHWSGQGAAFEELEVLYVAEPSTKLALLLSEEADIVVLPRELQPDALDAGFEIISSTGPAMQTSMLFNGVYLQPGDEDFNPSIAWADVRIREAINRAIDREVLIEVLYDGRADPLVVFAMDPRHEGYSKDLEERFEAWYGYDPERAKELLAEAGYPDAFDDPVIPILVTTLAGNPEFPTMAELMQVFLDEVGLQTEMVELDWAGLASLRRARQADLFHPMRNAPVRPTEVGIDAYYTSHNRPFNVFEDETTEALVLEYKDTVDPEERDRLAQGIFTHLFETYASVPIAAVAADVAVNPSTIAGWTFPGVTSAGLSHFHLIQPAN